MKMVNRFWDWLFHPSVRWYRPQKGKALMFRYPSPGSGITSGIPRDYRQPYQTSPLNIRYVNPTPMQVAISFAATVADSTGLTATQKLIMSGMLKRQQQNNQQAITKAKEQYLKEFGFSVDVKIYRNDLKIHIPETIDKQSFKYSIEAAFHSLRQSRRNNYSDNRKTLDEPQLLEMQSLDLYCDARFQQGRIENEYYLDSVINQRIERGQIPIRKGQSSFWKALDDSNDPHNIQNVQKIIKDPKPLNFQLRDAAIKLVKNKNNEVVDLEKK